MKQIAILGSTGSIGRQTLEVIAAHPDRFCVYGLAAGQNMPLLRQQIDRFKPKLVVVANAAAKSSLGLDRTLVGSTSLEDLASHQEVDLVMVATTGSVGLLPTLAAVRASKQVALANKEVLVMAGSMLLAEAQRFGVTIRPVDSEHSALWQCLQGEESEAVRRLYLTASGGAFRDLPIEALSDVKLSDTLNHPTWKMGPKVTIDSSTLMNKGFEVIEAHFLFGVPYEQIEVLIHRQSIVHSMIEFHDGSIKAQLGVPDMRLPIQYALTFPDRAPSDIARINWENSVSLTFERPDLRRFPCLGLAYDAGRRGGTYPTMLTAADEVAVELFVQSRVTLARIPGLIEAVLNAGSSTDQPTLDDINQAYIWAREKVLSISSNLAN